MLARRVVFTAFTIVFLSHLLPVVSYADNATVLPEGFWLTQTETRFFLDITEVWNTDGDLQPIGAPFSRPIAGPLLGLPVGANLGTTQVGITYNQEDTRFLLAYGWTDRLVLGARLRYFWSTRADVNSFLNTSAATAGSNPTLLPPTPTNPASLGFPCDPPGPPFFGGGALGCTTGLDMALGTTPATVDQINQTLIANGFAPISDWQTSGPGDLELGARYQYYRSRDFRAAFTGAVSVPTGEEDDPNNLIDVGLGTGAWALIAQLQQDWLYQRAPSLASRLGFPSPGDFYVNTQFEYRLNLPDNRTFRVCPRLNPICPTLADLDRDLGDLLTVEASTAIGLWPKGLVFTPLYFYEYKLKDDFSGPAGVPVEVLEVNSSQQTHSYKLTLTYTTIPLVIEKKFPVPLNVSVVYRDRFAGNNFVFDTEYIGFNITVYLR